MAITYLSGQRIQGSSTFASSGKIAGTSGTGSVFANWGRSGDANDNLSYDLGATLSDTEWVMRFKLYIDTITLNSGSGCNFSVQMSDADADAVHGASQDSISFVVKFSSGTDEQNFKSCNSNGAEIETNSVEIGTNMLLTAAGKTFYIEIKRTSGTAGTVSVTENSDYTTSATTVSMSSLSASTTGLRYFGVSLSTGSPSTVDNHVYGNISEVKIYDDETGTTTVDYDVGEFMKATTGWKINGSAVQNVIPIETDEKTTVTDVPVGSQFEETNTRKFYQRADASTYTQSDDSSSQGAYDDAVEVVGGKITTSASTAIKAVLGNSVTTCKLKLRKVGTPSGTITAGVWRTGSGGTIIHTFGTMEASALTTSFVEYTFTSASAYTFVADDIIGFKYYGTAQRVDSAIGATSLGSAGYPQLRYNEWDNPDAWATYTNSGGVYFILEKPASWVERGTAI